MTAGLRQFPAFFSDVPGDRKDVRLLFTEQHGRGRGPWHPALGHRLLTAQLGARGQPAWAALHPLGGGDTVGQ